MKCSKNCECAVPNSDCTSCNDGFGPDYEQLAKDLDLVCPKGKKHYHKDCP